MMSPSRGVDTGFADPFGMLLSSTSSGAVLREAAGPLPVALTVEDARGGSAEVARGVEAIVTSAFVCYRKKQAY